MVDGAIDLEDESSILARWIDANEASLDAPKNTPIELGDTKYRQHEAERKEDVVEPFKR